MCNNVPKAIIVIHQEAKLYKYAQHPEESFKQTTGIL